MRIEIKGRNVTVGDDLRERVQKRFEKIAKQVSELAEMEVELTEEKNPRIADSEVVEATLHLKRATLRAREASPEMLHSIHVVAEATLRLKGVTLRARNQSDSMVRSINEVADDLTRQVKRHRDKRRKRTETRRFAESLRRGTA